MERDALEQLESYRDGGVVWGRWLSAGDGNECEVCLTANDTVVRLKDVAKPWHEGCGNEICRCVLIAAEVPDGE